MHLTLASHAPEVPVPKQRNVSGYPLNSLDLGRVIGPNEEFEHDVLITGCLDLDAADEDTSGTGDEDEPTVNEESTL